MFFSDVRKLDAINLQVVDFRVTQKHGNFFVSPSILQGFDK
jgi:hypothetical protein